jgi:hypothetical protein
MLGYHRLELEECLRSWENSIHYFTHTQ